MIQGSSAQLPAAVSHHRALLLSAAAALYPWSSPRSCSRRNQGSAPSARPPTGASRWPRHGRRCASARMPASSASSSGTARTQSRAGRPTRSSCTRSSTSPASRASGQAAGRIVAFPIKGDNPAASPSGGSATRVLPWLTFRRRCIKLAAKANGCGGRPAPWFHPLEERARKV